ncbi:MAG: hypothetical protein L3J88_01960 [Gammaproteobacteria bacterium]|nr:hypothetical protein [Gammaproteobacteria bacterium]MCF6362129.1 hypothetical protein [Gammaproteobacteria bacterium]
MKAWNKILLTLGAILTSPLAQAHDNSLSTGLLAHAWAHGVEIAGTGTGLILGILFIAALLIGLFNRLAGARSARLRATTANHA